MGTHKFQCLSVGVYAPVTASGDQKAQFGHLKLGILCHPKVRETPASFWSSTQRTHELRQVINEKLT